MAHRGEGAAAPESVAPWSVNMLATEIEEFGRDRRWLWCTAAIVLMAELVFCADAGGIFPARDNKYGNLDADMEALRIVRNATFHPAFQSGTSGSGQPPIERLFVLLDNDDDAEVREVAIRLATDWSYFATRPITSYALRKLNSGGHLYVDRLHASGRLEAS